MSPTLRDAFSRGFEDAGRVDVDIAALVKRGETRLRRRRTAAVLGSMAVVVLVVAAVAGVTAGHRDGRGDGPVRPPSPAPTPSSTRQIVYSDVQWTRHGVIGDVVHYGGRRVTLRGVATADTHLDVTDDGFLYTGNDASVWFSDGATPVEVGSHLCGADQHGEFSHFATGAVVTANSGPWAAWVDCTQPARPALVVFDTASGREAVRRAVDFCRNLCGPTALTERYVYLGRDPYTAGRGSGYRLDLSSHRLQPWTGRMLIKDIAHSPRGLVIGDTWSSGTVTSGALQRFAVVGSRLVPLDARDRLTTAFDTATGRAVHLHLPAGYPRGTRTGSSGDFPSVLMFEWLDDDTVALSGQDILTCRLSTGDCVVAVPWPESRNPRTTHRILPAYPLPG